MREPAYDFDGVRVFCGDALTVLREMPSESVQTCVTSPPYFGLRAYLPAGHADKPLEIGAEDTPAAYIARLVEVFAEVKRVLKADGVMFVNMGDSYAGSWGNYAPGGIKGTQRPRTDDGKRWERPAYGDTTHKPATADVKGFRPKCLMMIPARLAIALCDDGWILRSDIIWHKPNCMPSSVQDRPTTAHETVYLFAKSQRYYYDGQAIAEPSITQDIRKPYAPGQVDARGNGHDRGGGKPRKVRKPAGWDTGPGSHGTIHRDGRAQEIEYTETSAETRSSRSVWTIPTKSFAAAHFATFPPELARRCIVAGSPEHCCSNCGGAWDDNKPSCVCDMHGNVFAPDDMEIIHTPTGNRAGDDPSLITGRAGMNRPRGDNEGQRPITRYEQRVYAIQLKASPHKKQMQCEAGEAWAHYVRTDRSGARPVPPELLSCWIARGWLTPVELPTPIPYPPAPSVVLDPFMGAGTTALVAKQNCRRAVGVELNADYISLISKRLAQATLFGGEDE